MSYDSSTLQMPLSEVSMIIHFRKTPISNGINHFAQLILHISQTQLFVIISIWNTLNLWSSSGIVSSLNLRFFTKSIKIRSFHFKSILGIANCRGKKTTAGNKIDWKLAHQPHRTHCIECKNSDLCEKWLKCFTVRPEIRCPNGPLSKKKRCFRTWKRASKCCVFPKLQINMHEIRNAYRLNNIYIVWL